MFLPRPITEIARPDFVVKGEVAGCQLPKVAAARTAHRMFAKEMPPRWLSAFSVLNEYEPPTLKECQLHCLRKTAFFFIYKLDAVDDDKDFMVNTSTQLWCFIKSMNFAINLDAHKSCSLQSTKYIGVILVPFQTECRLTCTNVNNFTP